MTILQIYTDLTERRGRRGCAEKTSGKFEMKMLNFSVFFLRLPRNFCVLCVRLSAFKRERWRCAGPPPVG